MVRRSMSLPLVLVLAALMLSLAGLPGQTSSAGEKKKKAVIPPPTAPVPAPPNLARTAEALPSPQPPAPPVGLPAAEPVLQMQQRPQRKGRRFHFKFNADTPLESLLPVPPKGPAPAWSPWNEDLARVPELALGEPMAKDLGKATVRTIAHGLAKVNHLNQKQADGFMKTLISQRSDLRGMPFLLGQDCRMPEQQAVLFRIAVEGIQKVLQSSQGTDAERRAQEWAEMSATINLVALTPDSAVGKMLAERGIAEFTPGVKNMLYRALVAALMQIMGPESPENRVAMAGLLATVPHVDATRALVKLVLFSPEAEVRAAAVEGLKLRREQDYTELLLQGFQYPLPAVSRRAAEALVELERRDVLARLVEVLEQPDPRLPTLKKIDGQEVSVVRELVRVNHHRNCLLCHAPGNTETVPEDVLKVPVPRPDEPLPAASDGYRSLPTPTPDILVRVDMTYLRQDFSLRMPVADADPWPTMQRFDFFVRTRSLTEEELESYREPAREPGWQSPYHRAALYALRELTGRDTEPTPQAWRQILNLAQAKAP